MENRDKLYNRIFYYNEVPTVPLSDYKSDGTWVHTDVYKGQVDININTDRIWYRQNSGITELLTENNFSGFTDDLYVNVDGDTMTGDLTFAKIPYPATTIFNTNSGRLSITNSNGSVDIGASNTTYCWFNTDRPRFYFTRLLELATGFIQTNGATDLNLRTRQGLDGAGITLQHTTNNVGIGTTTPNRPLEIYNDVFNDTKIRITDSGAGADNLSGIETRSNATNFQMGALLWAQGSGGVNSYSRWQVADSSKILRNRVNVDVDGNVGIGTITPARKLDVYSNIVNDANIRITDNSGSASHRSSIEFYNDNGNFNHAKISSQYGAGLQNSDLLFQVADSGQTLQDRMVIDVEGNVGICTTTPSYKLDVDGDLRVNNTIYTNETDLVIDPSITGKTMVLAQPVYDDIYIGIASAKVPTSNTPTWSSFVGNLNNYTFAVGDYIEGSAELSHKYKEGTDLEIHMHWTNNGVDVTDTYIKWEVEYTIANIGEVFSGTTIISAEDLIPASTTDRTQFYTSIGIIPGTGRKISDMISLRIRRITSTGTAPTNDPFGLQVGVHYQIDTLGSRDRGIK